MKMKNYLAVMALLLLASACQNDDGNEPAGGEQMVAVSFGGPVVTLRPALAQAAVTRASDEAFETGDEIGIFAVKKQAGAYTLLAADNYADNHCYRCESDGSFSNQSGEYIWQYPRPKLAYDLCYWAVYPYSSSLTVPTFYYNVEADQSVAANYAQSDLCLDSVHSLAVDVEFKMRHVMACIEVNLSGEGLAGHTFDAYVSEEVSKGVAVNLNAMTIVATAATVGNITCRQTTESDGSITFRALVAPQVIELGGDFFSVVIDGDSAHPLEFDCPRTQAISSGKRWKLMLELNADGELLYEGSAVDNYGSGSGMPLDP